MPHIMWDHKMYKPLSHTHCESEFIASLPGGAVHVNRNFRIIGDGLAQANLFRQQLHGVFTTCANISQQDSLLMFCCMCDQVDPDIILF